MPGALPPAPVRARACVPAPALLVLALLAACARAEAAGPDPQAAPAPVPAIAVLIDDMGYRRAEGLRALALPGPLAFAFLPHTPHAAALARLAHLRGKDVLLHQPMEPAPARAPEPGGLHAGMGADELDRTLAANLAAVPHARGVNNHMGSLLTRDPRAMRLLMTALRRRGGLYFVDSRTTPRSVAWRAARSAGVPSIERDVFLDNEPDPGRIRARFTELVARAHERGAALAIGHPRPGTLAVLARELARLDAHGVRLVAVSRLVARASAAGRALARY